jgi:WD40 repeat protein
LFPLLRKEHFLPVYSRLDLRDRTTALVAQLRTAFQDELTSHRVDAPPFQADESLWRYLHRSQLELWSEQNQLLTPLFVLDQFEEVFTLGAENPDAISRLRIDLADLIENRMPSSLAQAAGQNEAAAAGLSPDTQRYKVLLSFREDFLPAMEGWKRDIASILRNRLRLLPMSSEQAYEAVHTTASHLVDQQTARKIVRFVAAAQEDNTGASGQTLEAMAEVSIEPALLSLVCHGLNEKRRVQGKATFDEAFLSGNAQSIISDYYNKAVGNLPDPVQRFIEKELITERGFRKQCDVDDAVAIHDVSADELRLLVDRRLLRIEPQRGTDRVELTHDLLTRVVREKRDQRRAQDKELAEQERIRQNEIERRREEEEDKKRRRNRLVARALVAAIVVAGGFGLLAFEAWTQRGIASREAAQAMRNADEAARQKAIAEANAAEATRQRDIATANEAEAKKQRSTADALRRVAEQEDAKDRTRKHQADSLRLATDALAVKDSDSELSVLLAIEAASATKSDKSVTPEAEDVLHQTVQAASRIRLRPLALPTGKVGMKFSPDMKMYVVANPTGPIRIWEIASSHLDPRKPDIVIPNAGRLYTFAFSPDSNYLAMATGISNDRLAMQGDRAIHVRHISTGKDIVIPTQDNVDSISFSQRAADELLVAGYSNDGDAQLWNVSVAAGEFKSLFPAPIKGATAIAFSSTGKYFAMASHDSVRLWNPATGAMLADMPQHGEVRRIVFTADDKLVAMLIETSDSATKTQSNEARIWDISALPAKELEYFGTSYPLKLQALSVQNETISDLLLAPSGNRLFAITHGSGLTVWDISGNRVRTTNPQITREIDASAARSLVLSRGGDRLLISYSSSRAVVLNATTLTELFTLPGDSSNVADWTFSQNGLLGSVSTGGFISIWNTLSGDDSLYFAGEAQVFRLAFSSDGSRLAVATERGITIWNTRTGKLDPVSGRIDGVKAVAFGTHRIIATATPDKMANLWNADSGTKVLTLKGHSDQVKNVAFSPNSLLLATASFDGTAKLWSTANGQLLHTFSGHTAPLQDVAFSPNGKYLATASSDNTARLWETETGRFVRTLAGHKFWVMGVAFSADGMLLATSSADGTVKLWDVASGKLMLTLSHQGQGPVYAAAFTPDGKRLATASDDARVRIWDVTTGDELFALSNDGSAATAIAFSPNGSLLATASVDGSTIVYDMDAVQLVSRAGGRVQRKLELSDCKQYHVESQHCEALRLNADGENLAAGGDLYHGIQEMKQARELDSTIPGDPQREASRLQASSLVGSANFIIAVLKNFSPTVPNSPASQKAQVSSQIASVVSALQKANTLDHESVKPEDWNRLCWFGSIYGSASQVLFACDKALQAMPNDWSIRDSRGLARALTGDTKGAIEDFEFFIDHTPLTERKTQRQRWVDALKQRQNPFTPAELATLTNQ